MLDKAIEILKTFEEKGYEAYIVGGFVRDFVLNKESVDIDIATNATPKDIQQIFHDVKLPFEQYGAVLVTYKKNVFEITTYRMDLEYRNNRFPSKIIYTDKLVIDLKRRDFTMNTLCMNSKKEILDVLGIMDDIKNRVIRCVGDADKRLEEDALRILRAIRFASVLDFDMDAFLKESIFRNRASLKNLSFYRKKQELNKIFSCANVLKGINLIREFDLESYLDIRLNDNIVKTNDPLGIWLQVNPSEEYQFTNNEKAYLKAIKHVVNDKTINDIELYHNGNYVCYIAAQILGIDAVNIYDRFDALPITKSSDVKVSQKDIIDILKLEDKSLSKSIFKEVENKILLKELVNDKDIIEKYLIDTYS